MFGATVVYTHVVFGGKAEFPESPVMSLRELGRHSSKLELLKVILRSYSIVGTATHPL